MKKSYYIGVGVLALLITTLAVSAVTFAFSGKTGHHGYTNYTGHFGLKTNFTAEKQSLADMTYEQWEAQMQAKVQAMRDQANELESNITEENFATLQEIEQLIADGNFEEAKALRSELDMFGYGDKTDFKKDGHWVK